MIQTAIHEMNEENGSTAEAINDYIMNNFTSQLPFGHPNLFPYHFKKLLNSDEIQEIHSVSSSPRYIISPLQEDSADEVDVWCLAVKQKSGRPPLQKAIVEDKSLNTNKRRRGRPPKDKIISDHQPSKIQDPTLNNCPKSLTLFKRRLRGSPTIPSEIPITTNVSNNILTLSEEVPKKRGPGRPPKKKQNI